MGIGLEFIDFVVPIDTIRRKYPGGWEQCLMDHQHLVGGRVWYDDALFRDGAMSPDGIKAIVEHWDTLGFSTIAVENGIRVWKDVCVIESISGGPTLPCDWIVFDAERRAAYLKGGVLEPIIGRKQMTE